MTWDCQSLFDETDDGNSYLPNKAGKTFMRLIHEEWKTKQTIQIKEGVNDFFFRGFMGDYNLKILRGSTIIGEIEFKLDNDMEILCVGEGSSTIICNQS